MKMKLNLLPPAPTLSARNLSFLSTSPDAATQRQPPGEGMVKRRRVCVCCGEPMFERGNGLSRNPNVCASCSSLTDGMEEDRGQALRDRQRRTNRRKPPTIATSLQP